MSSAIFVARGKSPDLQSASNVSSTRISDMPPPRREYFGSALICDCSTNSTAREASRYRASGNTANISNVPPRASITRRSVLNWMSSRRSNPDTVACRIPSLEARSFCVRPLRSRRRDSSTPRGGDVRSLFVRSWVTRRCTSSIDRYASSSRSPKLSSLRLETPNPVAKFHSIIKLWSGRLTSKYQFPSSLRGAVRVQLCLGVCGSNILFQLFNWFHSQEADENQNTSRPDQNTSQPGRPQEISRSDGKLVMIWQPSLVTTTSSSMRAAPEPSSAPFQVSSANTMPSFSGVFWPV